MKAIIYTKYGTPDVLQVKQVDKPIPKDNEVLIKVFAVEATKSDCEMRSFNFPVKWFWLPLRLVIGLTKPKRQILGMYFSGLVKSVGKDVANLKEGEQVFGSSQLKMGAYAEYLVLPSNYTIVAKPKNMSYAESAAVTLGGLNALHYLTNANIKKGEKVLINGAGGSIGLFAVQLAKNMGAEVTGVDSGIKEAMLRETGVDHFIDYRKNNFIKNGQSYDVIFDMLAKKSYSGCIISLNPGGRYIIGNPRFIDMLRSFITTKLTNKQVLFAFAGEKQAELLILKTMIEQGELKSVVDRIYPMEEAAQAHQRVETEQRLGSVVIMIGS